MSPLRLLIAEILYRKANFLLAALAVAIAAALFIAAPTVVDGYRRQTAALIDQWQAKVDELETQVGQMKAGIERVEDETRVKLDRLEKQTRRVMRDLGFNLMITHEKADMSDFWSTDFAAADMPQEYVDRLAKDPRLTAVTHLVATLQARLPWEKRNVLVVGYLPETPQASSGEKSPMGLVVPKGKAVLGWELAGGRKPGDTIELEGPGGVRKYQVQKILPERGSKDDITIALHLSDAQDLLAKPGRINQIMALSCQCEGPRLATIRQQLADVLPGTRITEFNSLAVARAEQRALVEGQQKAIVASMRTNLEQRQQLLAERRGVLADLEVSRARVARIVELLAAVLTPLVVVTAAVWVGLQALGNVRQRRSEIGLLRAVGKGSGTIATLFLGKAVLLGALGAILGTAAGVTLAQWLGRAVLEIDPAGGPRWELLAAALLGAPLLAALASYLPTLWAMTQDPAVALREI